LPACKDFINEDMWPDIAESISLHRGSARKLRWLEFLPLLNPLINEKTWPLLIKDLPKIVDSVYNEEIIRELFEVGLPACKDFINETMWHVLVKMIVATRHNSVKLLTETLPLVRNIIDEKTWPNIVKIVDYTRRDVQETLKILPYTLEQGVSWTNLIKLVRVGKTNSSKLLRSLLIVKAKLPHRWPGLVEDFILITKTAGDATNLLFSLDFQKLMNLVRSEEDWEVLFNFILWIKDNKQKMKLLNYLNNISDRLLGKFRNFMLLVMDKQKNHVFSLLNYVRAITLLEVSIRDEILQFVMIIRSFDLVAKEHPDEKFTRYITNAYIFLSQGAGKDQKKIESGVAKLEKTLKRLSVPLAQSRQAAVDKIGKIFAPLLIEFLKKFTSDKLSLEWHRFTGVSIDKSIKQKYLDDLLFALLIAKGSYRPESKELLREIALGNFWPEMKIPKCYPYNKKQNQKFVRRMERKGINMEPWIYGFEKEIPLSAADVDENTHKILDNSIKDTLELFRELGIETTPDQIEESFQKIRDHENQELRGFWIRIYSHIHRTRACKDERPMYNNFIQER